jgi:rubredoxin
MEGLSNVQRVLGGNRVRAFGYSLCFSAGAAVLAAVIPCSGAAQVSTVDVEAGPISSQADAQTKCPQVAHTNGGVWTGQWHTTVPGTMSVCEIRVPSNNRPVENVEAGPIWNQTDAQSKCPQVAATNGGVWTGQWSTTVPGSMSVCQVRFHAKRQPVVKDIQAGPIWNQTDAQTKCPQVAQVYGGTWTGKWHTTVPGTMSVCQIRFAKSSGA